MKLGDNTFLKHLVKDTLPENNVLFWDTSLPASAIFQHPESDKRKAAINFIDRLIKEKTYIAFSSILSDEFLHIAARNEIIKSQYSRAKVQAALTRRDQRIIKPHIADI